MVLFFKILLIILVAAPVIVFAFFLWLQLDKYVRHKNKQDEITDPPAGKKRKRK